MKEKVSIGIWKGSENEENIFSLSEQLSIPVIENIEDKAWILGYENGCLQLWPSDKKKGGAVYVDFAGGKMKHRNLSGGAELIARAVGARKGNRPDIWDLTAGLGRDSFVLATLGCRVQMLERSPVIAELLKDGLERLHTSGDDEHSLPEKMSLHQGDAIEFLKTGVSDIEPQVIYMDPMYPHRDKSALVKKEMRCLRAIVGDDQDVLDLFSKARSRAFSRVVVKRPIRAPLLIDEPPHIQFKGKSTRFDCYLPV